MALHTLRGIVVTEQQFFSQHTAFNDHWWFCKSELLAILCTHNTDVHLQGVECISCVCGVKAVECRSRELLSTQPSLPTSAMTLLHWHFGPNIGIFGPFDLMPDQKTMRTSCLGGFLLCWYQNFYLLP